MTQGDFKVATLQDFKDACSAQDVDDAINILVDHFADNISNDKPYNFSPAIQRTLGDLANDAENASFIKLLLEKITAEFKGIEDLHLAILGNKDSIQHTKTDTIIDPADAGEEYYHGDGSDLAGIDDDPDGSYSDLDFNI